MIKFVKFDFKVLRISVPFSSVPVAEIDGSVPVAEIDA
jgi:hypothetical protein